MQQLNIEKRSNVPYKVEQFINEKKVSDSVITTMKRVEMKYILNAEQLDYLQEALKGHMEVDQYGLTSIASLYFDTPNHRLVRNSIEKPLFKEKIRLRSYGLAKENSKVYLELKRKTEKIVYKRRITTTQLEVEDFLSDYLDYEGQIGKELNFFRDQYKELVPSFLIIYDRLAYYEPNGNLRLTIDQNPRYRVKDLNLSTSLEGNSLLPKGNAILEIKVQEAMPLWLVRILNEGKIYQSSFSKVGEAYKREMSLRKE